MKKIVLCMGLLTGLTGACEPAQHSVIANNQPALQVWQEGGENMLQLVIDNTPISVRWEDNPSVRALRALAATRPLTVQMTPYGGFEQVGSLGATLPKEDVHITTEAGDIMLYSGNQIVLFYGSNSWAYTRLGKIEGVSRQQLTEMLRKKAVKLTLSVR